MENPRDLIDLERGSPATDARRQTTRNKIFDVIGDTMNFTADVGFGTGKALAYGTGRIARGTFDILHAGMNGLKNKDFPH